MRFILIILFFLSSIASANEAMEYYEQALTDFNADKLPEAEIAVKNSLKLSLDYLPARLLLGNILLKTGNPQAAEKEFEKALFLQADSRAVVFSLVEVKLLLNKAEEALTLLISTPKLQNQARYYHLQGNTYQALAKYNDGMKAYEKAISMQITQETQSNRAQLYTDLAQLLYGQEKIVQAQLQITKALEVTANFIPALLLSSEIHKSQSEFCQAQENISVVLQNEPHNKKALFAQTGLYLAQNLLPEALEVALTLREEAPNDPYAKLLHSSIVAGQGDTKQARRILIDIKQQLSGVDEKFSDERQVLNLSATVDFINTNYHSASKQFLRYIQLYGEHSNARKTLAIIAVRLQDLPEAQIHIEHALRKNPNSAELYILAAEIYRQANLPEQQLAILKKAHQRFNDNIEIHDHYIASLLSNNLFDQALLLLNQSNQKNNLQNRTLLAFMQLQTGLLEQAKASTQHLLNDYPDKVEILQLAGEVSLKTNQDIEKAIYFFKQALVLDKNFSPALLALAGIHLQQGELGKVEKLYQQLLTINEDDALSLQLYADLAMKQGNLPLAIKLLTPLYVDNDYKTGRALISLYIATKQPQKALTLLTELEQRNSFDQDLLLSKSHIQVMLGQNTVAQKTLKIIFGLVYDESDKLIVLAHAQLDLSDVEAANKTIDRLKSLEQIPVPAYLQARLYLTQNKYTQAMGLISQSLKMTPNAQHWLLLKVHVLIEQEHFNDAVNIAEYLFKQNSSRKNMQLLAQLYGQQQQVKQLNLLLSNWIQQTPQDEWAVAQLSALALAQGDYQQAVNVLESYPNLHNQAIFLNNLANYYLKSFNENKEAVKATELLSKAIDYAEQAYKIAPHSAAVNDTLGWLYIKKGQIAKGVSLLREAVARDSTNGEIYYHLAYALASSENINQALNALNKAIELSPEHALRQSVSQKVSQ